MQKKVEGTAVINEAIRLLGLKRPIASFPAEGNGWLTGAEGAGAAYNLDGQLIVMRNVSPEGMAGRTKVLFPDSAAEQVEAALVRARAKLA